MSHRSHIDCMYCFLLKYIEISPNINKVFSIRVMTALTVSPILFTYNLKCAEEMRHKPALTCLFGHYYRVN